VVRWVAQGGVRYAAGMTQASDPEREKTRAGLCSDCVHARRVDSDRGSVFFLCELSASDPRFPKYPRLPIVSCPGYRKIKPG
jgi:hypothetical protein